MGTSERDRVAPHPSIQICGNALVHKLPVVTGDHFDHAKLNINIYRMETRATIVLVNDRVDLYDIGIFGS